MRSISCCKQDRWPENVFDRQLCDGGSGKDPVRDAIFSVGARNESRVLSLMSALPVNAGTPTSPMRMLSRCSEHPLDIPIERPQHTDARMHQRFTIFCGHDQRLDRGLPRIKILFRPSEASRCSRRRRAESRAGAQPAAGWDHRKDGPRWQRAWIVRSAICLQGCAECSSGVLFRRFDRRSFWADCSAFLSRSRSSFNSEN
jgi:hypothetical protein